MAEKTGLEAELSVPNHILVPSGAKTIDVDVLATLHNHDEDDCAVHVNDADGAHFWQLLDDKHKEVQRSAQGETAKGLEGCRTQTVKSGEGLSEPQTVTLDAGNLKDGRRYTMRYVLWGEHAAEASINVTRAAAPAKAKAKGKKGKR